MLNSILMASYFLSNFFNITAFQDVPHLLSYRKLLTSYSGNNKLNIAESKEYDNFSLPSPKHNCVHIQFCAFYVLSVC